MEARCCTWGWLSPPPRYVDGSGLPARGMLFLETHPPAKKWESYRTTQSKASRSG